VRLQFLQLLQARAKQLYFYNYGYCHPVTGIWRYVGVGHTKAKGRYDRKSAHLEYAKCLDKQAVDYPNPQLIYWIRKLKREEGLEPKIVILKGGMSQGEAYANEQILIALFGRTCDGGTLYNLDSGGLGGKQHSEETKLKISESNKGKNLGKKPSEESNQKRSVALKGRSSKPTRGFKGKSHTEESNSKNSASHLGKKHSEESLFKMSLSQRGRQHSEESKLKMSESHKGKKISEETRRKQSESAKARWARTVQF
jgi:hypothetical protein